VNFIEEQFKDDKYQLHFYYNKYLTIEEEAEIVIMDIPSSSIIPKYYCCATAVSVN
jgi:hypothetical protein